MKEEIGPMLVIVYAVISMLVLQARKPKFSRTIGTGEIPLQWFRLSVGDVESLHVKTAYFGIGKTFKECGFSIPDTAVEKTVAILLLASPRSDGSTLICVTQSFGTRIYDEMWTEFDKKGGAVKWLDKRSWIATSDDEKMQAEVDAFCIPEGGLNCIISHEQDIANGSRTRYDVKLAFQDSL